MLTFTRRQALLTAIAAGAARFVPSCRAPCQGARTAARTSGYAICILLPSGGGHGNMLARVRKVAEANLGSAISIEPLFVDAGMYICRPRSVVLDRQSAWNLAHRIVRDSDAQCAEPDALGPGITPTAEPLVAVAKSALCDLEPKPLPGTEIHNWLLDNVHAYEAWAVASPTGQSKGGGISVAHIDTGYTRHSLIDGSRLWTDKGYDFVDCDPDALDHLKGFAPGHGTSTASVIMANEGTPPEMSGVAPESRLVPYRVTTEVVIFDWTAVVQALNRASTGGHHVASISLGGLFGPRFLEKAATVAIQRGVVVVAAAGHCWRIPVFPAALPGVVCVAASTIRDLPWEYTAHGRPVSISAPGVTVWRAEGGQPGSKEMRLGSGTSFSTAAVAGACALWQGHHGRAVLEAKYGKSGIARAFKICLQASARVPAGWDATEYGAGILNAAALVSHQLPPADGTNAISEADVRPLLGIIAPDLDRRFAQEGLSMALGIEGSKSRDLIANLKAELEQALVMTGRLGGLTESAPVENLDASIKCGAVLRSFGLSTTLDNVLATICQ
jgi:hypothetical protein